MSQPINPYQSPQEYSKPMPPPGASGVSTAPCPSCGNAFGKKASFTWWGGALGPWLLSHVNCSACGVGFNSKTGKSNNTAIAIYLVVGVVIGLAVGVGMALSGN